MEKAIVTMDNQGRIYFPKHLKEKHSKKFYYVRMKDRIILVPIPTDPVRDLAEIGKKLPKGKTIKQLRKEALDEAYKEIDEELV